MTGNKSVQSSQKHSGLQLTEEDIKRGWSIEYAPGATMPHKVLRSERLKKLLGGNGLTQKKERKWWRWWWQ